MRILKSSLVWIVGILVFCVAVTVLLRGEQIASGGVFNPDEAEAFAIGKAAMASPTPWSTWTTGSTGPVLPWFVAIFGAFGWALTLKGAHLLAAVLVGVIGALGILLCARSMGRIYGFLTGATVWLGLALVYPFGSNGDFGGFASELVPGVLILSAALVPTSWLQRSYWAWSLVAALCGLAIAAKYQALPLAVLLVAAHLVAVRMPWRRVIFSALSALAGAMLPVAIVAGLILLTGTFRPDLLSINFDFLTAYSSGGLASFRHPESQWLIATRMILSSPVTWVMLLIVGVQALRSTWRINTFRAIVLCGGFLCVAIGAAAFPHYVHFACFALVIAAAAPVEPGREFLPALRWKIALLTAGVLVAGSAVAVVAVHRGITLAGPDTVAVALTERTDPAEPALAEACPPGSTVVVWGWANELYLQYDWKPISPFFVTIYLEVSEAVEDRAKPLVRDAIEQADCVVDGSGAPFFQPGGVHPLLVQYPDLEPLLDEQFDYVEDAKPCPDCAVYVSKATS